ncbi:YqaA family protein [Motilimonas pumila]|uniref:DedA family protein n=1 Tax=Motilimonas pumila TaxID=2303987 RepID=A0A418YKS5_9GAMM|nr:YqaA family protein [Motilimonas pumila]RJG51567.1 DedA family protein [Motilimonas pumila]
MELWLLFSSSFISATILPGGSEALLAALVVKTPMDIATFVWIATLGNVLGAATTFGLGALAHRRRTQLELKYKKAIVWCQKYGCWSLLLSWLPVVGDALCFCAGWLRLPIALSMLLIFVGKLLRYYLVAWLALGVFG